MGIKMRSNAYKILIADEETRYVSMINRLTETSLEKTKVIKHAVSRKETIAQIKELAPDILVIDINLDELSGLETIKKIRKFNKTVHIIILTRCESFELMKRAIPLRLDAYLLKPIRRIQLSKEIQKVLDILEIETEEKEKAADKELSRLECLKFTEYSYIYSVLFNGEYTIDFPSYQKELCIGTEGYIMNIEIRPKNKDKVIDLQKASNRLYQCIKETIGKKNACVVGPRILNRVIVFVCDENKRTTEQRKYTIQMCDEIIEKVLITLGIKIVIGVGSIKSCQQIYVSYEEALRVLRYKKGDDSKSVHIYDVTLKCGEISKTYVELERIMLANIKGGQDNAIENFADLSELVKDFDLETRKNKMIEILVLCCNAGRIEEPNENSYLDYTVYLEELKEISGEQLEGWALKKLQYIMKAIRIRKASQMPFAISNAVSFMQNHYEENIQLDDVAGQVGFTPQYFSTYFKEEMKCTFLDYLTELRMGKARELISTDEVSVQEICFLVGYHNPNYFSRIFKKCNGCTPSVYKKKLENKVKQQKENVIDL